MFRLSSFVLLTIVFLYALVLVSAQNSTSVSEVVDSNVDDEEARKRRHRFPFSRHHIWWWGLKALSVFVTVKIKIILLLLFIGGGIFYGLKIWQGTALGCPEPIVQEIVKNHHGISDILPYHSHFSSDDSYPGPSFHGSSYPGSYLGSDIYSGSNDYSGVYSNTPAAAASPVYSGPSYLPPGPGDSPSAPSGFSNRRKSSSTGRQISEESQTLFGDLVFRFLGVNTDQCRRRFVCELEFRNPFMGYAFKYIGVELFKEYLTPKDASKAPHTFTDCAKLYSECRAPNEQPLGIIKKRKLRRNKNSTTTPSIVEETTIENYEARSVSDAVSQYVQQKRK